MQKTEKGYTLKQYAQKSNKKTARSAHSGVKNGGVYKQIIILTFMAHDTFITSQL